MMAIDRMFKCSTYTRLSLSSSFLALSLHHTHIIDTAMTCIDRVMKLFLLRLQMIWVCILCRKKQELLIKTGQWIHSSMASRLRQLEAETPLSTSGGPAGVSSIPLAFDKRLRLERAYSTDKENQLFGTSGQGVFSLSSANRRGSLGGLSATGLSNEATVRSSALRRQWSQEAALLSGTSPVTGVSWNEPIRKLPDHIRTSIETRSPSPHLLSATSPMPPKSYSPTRGIISGQSEMAGHSDSRLSGSRVRLPTDDLTTMTTVESGIGSDTCTSTQAMMHRQGSGEMPRLGNITWSSLESGTGTAIGSGFESASLTSRHLARSQMASMHRQSSYSPSSSSHQHQITSSHHGQQQSSSSLMSSSNIAPGLTSAGPSAIGSIASLGETTAAATAFSTPGVPSGVTGGSITSSLEQARRNVFATVTGATSRYVGGLGDGGQIGGTTATGSSGGAVAAVSLAASGGAGVRLTSGLGGPFIRTDSSDQSEVQVEPSKVHSREHQRLRLRRERFHRQHFSLSSSEEELRTTPALLHGEDDYSSYYQSLHHHPHHHQHHHQQQQQQHHPSSSSGDHHPHSTPAGGSLSYSSSTSATPGHLKREELLDRKIKRFLAHPITWKPSSDGTRLIGHMILKKSLGDEPITGSSAALLGLKVVGGRITGSGTVGAVIEKVKKGSIADTVGKLRPGDEVLEWNGRSLQGLTFEETYDIMAESRQEPQVELIVCRHLRQRLPLTSPVPSGPNQQVIQGPVDPRSGTPGLPPPPPAPSMSVSAAAVQSVTRPSPIPPPLSSGVEGHEGHYIGHAKTPLIRRHTDINIQVPHYSPAKHGKDTQVVLSSLNLFSFLLFVFFFFPVNCTFLA